MTTLQKFGLGLFIAALYFPTLLQAQTSTPPDNEHHSQQCLTYVDENGDGINDNLLLMHIGMNDEQTGLIHRNGMMNGQSGMGDHTNSQMMNGSQHVGMMNENSMGSGGQMHGMLQSNDSGSSMHGNGMR